MNAMAFGTFVVGFMAGTVFGGWETLRADEIPSQPSAPEQVKCRDLAEVKAGAEGIGASWIRLTNDQWQFVRGISALDPETPPGLPIGDGAVLSQPKGQESGLIVFTDKDQACQPMRVPGALVKMIMDVGAGEIREQGDPM